MLWLLGACAFTSMASMRVCDSLLPALASDFSITLGKTTGVISGFTLAYGVLQLFYGPLGDRYGKLRVIGLAALASTAGNMAAAMSPSLDWLVASRVLSGAAAAGIIPLTMAWIGDSVAYEDRQAVLAQLLGATVSGMIGGQWLGGLVGEMLGWRAAFAVLAALFLASGWLLVVRSRGMALPQPAGFARAGFSTAGVLRLPWPRRVLGITSLEGAFAFGALTFIPTYLQTRFGLEMATAGALAALYGVGGLVYSGCARHLIRRLGESGLARLGGLALGAALATLAWLPSWGWAGPACLVAGFGFYALHNTLQTNATQMAPQARGTAVALFACMLFLGQTVGVLAAATVVEHFDASFVFAGSALGLLIVGTTWSALIELRRKAV